MIDANRFRLGLVARHLARPSFALADVGFDSAELATQVRIGGAWGSGWPGHSRVVVAVDSDLIRRATLNGERRDVATGVETWWFARRLGLRGGLRSSSSADSGVIASAGASAAVAGWYVEGFVAGSRSEARSWSLGLRNSF